MSAATGKQLKTSWKHFHIFTLHRRLPEKKMCAAFLGEFFDFLHIQFSIIANVFGAKTIGAKNDDVLMQKCYASVIPSLPSRLITFYFFLS